MATTLPSTDIVLVGVGWTGGIVAAELTKKGYQVVGLERGKPRTTEDYLMVHDELRYAQRNEMMQDLSKETWTVRHEPNQTALPYRQHGSFLIGDGVGGSGEHWNGLTYRFMPYDFEIRSKTIERYGESKIPADMPLQDWGITYDEMVPYFEKFEQMAGISGEPNPIKEMPQANHPTPPLKETPAMVMFREAATSLGYHPYTAPAATLSEGYTNPDGITRGACQYCGFCERFGCEYGAKASPTVTVLPVAEKTGNFEVRPYCNVRRILHENGKATGVLYVDSTTGEEFIQPAKVVVLSAYILNNVKLLLLSKIGTPYNHETQTGVIGKNYCYQMTSSASTGFFEGKEFNLYAGTGALAKVIDDFNGDNFDHTDLDFLHGGNIALGHYGKRPIATNSTPKGTPSWGAEFKDASVKWANSTLSVGSQGSVLPHKDNYLDLDPTYTDQFGDPLLRITFNYRDNERNQQKFIREITTKILEEMGATEVTTPGDQGDWDTTKYQTTHNTGGAIMGADPKTSALNNYLQMWDCENLFIPGANAFAHNSGMNPTGTVGALAYRAAEGIEKYLQNGGGSLV
ncbi:GMC family oxidoreductase [Ureibacillus massiliensis 4400831 = CIP 108448 = CCUG 49529]|uniref:GMC family oxidoreductase n=1 Tax=Ureibacillus massiliensis 4400831 = CIP 108448 = CCUG 49529 TaxID=1211035 RepID=A0A0A3IWL1_9BACL|nr:GMC family oxidoreductase [Ureibacillus massiliensis]KGR87800.1 GMC family oxidoreductase [Ureibacillus massiliensis 4400831 = CIP 108448 = CCUG 49529]